jgi:hypothetical protein
MMPALDIEDIGIRWMGWIRLDGAVVLVRYTFKAPSLMIFLLVSNFSFFAVLYFLVRGASDFSSPLIVSILLFVSWCYSLMRSPTGADGTGWDGMGWDRSKVEFEMLRRDITVD